MFTRESVACAEYVRACDIIYLADARRRLFVHIAIYYDYTSTNIQYS